MEKIKPSLFRFLWGAFSLMLIATQVHATASLEPCLYKSSKQRVSTKIIYVACTSNVYDSKPATLNFERHTALRTKNKNSKVPSIPNYALPNSMAPMKNHRNEMLHYIKSSPFNVFDMVNPNGAKDTFPFLSIFKQIKLPSFRIPFRPSQKIKTRIHTGKSSELLPNSKAYLKPYPCNVDFEGFDPVVGKRKKELSYEPLFSYTSPNIKPYIPGRDLLYADARLVKLSGGYKYLSLKFTWKAKSPESAYGHLKAQNAVRCLLSDNKSVTLFNSALSNWNYDAIHEHYILTAFFPINPKHIKILQKHSLSAIRIYWSQGYEDYPIYPITFFMDQLKCLD